MNVQHQPVVDRWLAAAARAPRAPACRDATTTRTHAEMLDLARRRAWRLRAGGIGVEDRVVVLLSAGAEQACWVAATALAGACAVPIGLHQPERRLADLVALARPAAVIVDRGTMHLAAGCRRYDGDDPGLPEGPSPPSDPDRAAYICFTSGTTGRPKGVVVPHGVIAHTSGEMAAYLGLDDRPRLHLLTTSWSFDVAMMDLWLALTTGGTLVVPARDDLLGPALFDTISRFTVPIVHGVPSLFGAASDQDIARLPAGTTVMLGGEPVPASLLGQLAEHADMHVVYGITETGVITTTHRATAATTPDVIGRPLPGVDCVVVDPDGRPLPAGEPGELLIGPPVVARGYLTDPAGTAARFTADESGVRRYRTGDLVRSDPDGTLHFLGRIDQQLKIRGHRIELAEIEHALLNLAGVRQAAAAAPVGPNGEKVLVAYLSGGGLDAAAVRRELAGSMPGWMVPTLVEVLPGLPTSVTGKVDRAALPEPRWPGGDGATDAPRTATDAPRTATERTLVELWQQLLGTATVAAADNFVELGGHSLKAAQLSTALRDRFGVTVPVPAVLTAPTLRKLAEIVDRAESSGRATGGPAPSGPTGTQRWIWLHQELASPAGLYNLVLTARLVGPLQVTALQRALHAVERRHPALRDGFDFDGTDVVRIARPPTDRPLRIVGVDPAEAIRAAGARAIDVRTEPPWHYQLIATAPDEHVLIITAHHIAVDGVAVYLILDEIALHYSALVERRPVAADRSRPPGLAPADPEEDLAFWTGLFADVPPATGLPGQRPTADPTDVEGWCRPVRLPRLAPSALRRTAAARGASVHAVLLSSFLRAVAERTATTDLVIDLPVSTRGSAADPAAIGMFVSALPVRFRLPPGLPAVGCLDAVNATIRRVHRHSAVDVAAVRSVSRAGRSDNGVPTARLVFVWDDVLPTAVFAGLDCSWDLEFTGWSVPELAVELAERADGVAGRAIGRRASAGVDVVGLLRATEDNALQLSDETAAG